MILNFLSGEYPGEYSENDYFLVTLVSETFIVYDFIRCNADRICTD